jgi:tryptophanase
MHAEKHSESREEIPAAMDLLHLAISRRVYTQSHIDHVCILRHPRAWIAAGEMTATIQVFEMERLEQRKNRE